MLEDYIQKSRASGVTDIQIRQVLIQAGWSANAVDQALTGGSINQSNQPLIVKSIKQVTRTNQPSSQLPHKKNLFRRWWFYLILVMIVALMAGGYFIFLRYYKNQETGNLIVIQNQVVMDKIHVDKLINREPAFLVIQPEDNLASGLVNANNHIAYTNIINPDTYEDFDINVFNNPGARTPPGTVFYATLYKDLDNNRYFDVSIDTEVLVDASGNKARVTFYAK